jgi:DNA (cytosine-5)-methyltransferase 1
LAEFLDYPGKPLSNRAASGFLRRTEKGTLRFPPGFLAELTEYAS